MSKSVRPPSRDKRGRRNSMCPVVPVQTNRVLIAVLQMEAARQFLTFSETNEIDLKFEDPSLAGEVLRALQDFPKPGKRYELTLVLSPKGAEEPVAIESVDRDTFRITRLRPPVPPPSTSLPPKTVRR